ncbi:hypothetical protein, partial [Streptomyces venezuelae]|uniref:hypothetical protein n=1 Tax=Streptomyces venezuelae TaxID=54571 RepID=UPI001F1CCC9F
VEDLAGSIECMFFPATYQLLSTQLVEEDLDAPIASAREMRVVGVLQDRSWWSRRRRPAFPVRHHHGHPGPGHDHRHSLPRPCPDVPEPHAGRQ